MAMRADCKYFQQRRYASGETARFCALDLAPEAPWRCPAECPRYTQRADARPDDEGTVAEADLATFDDAELHPDASSVLASAAEILSNASPSLQKEEEARRAELARKAQPSRWDKLRAKAPRWKR